MTTDFDLQKELAAQDPVSRQKKADFADLYPEPDEALLASFGSKELAAPAEQDAIDRAVALQEDDRELGYVTDLGVQLVGGVRDAANAVKDLPIDIGSFAAKTLSDEEGDKFIDAQASKLKGATDLPDVPESERTSLKFGRGVAQFLAPYAAVGKLKLVASAPAMGTTARAMLNGAVTDLAAFGSEEQRLADMAKEIGFDNPLAADEDDSALEKRFKTAVEGAGLGFMFDGLFKAFKASRQIVFGKQKAAQAAERVAERKALAAAVKGGIEEYAGNSKRQVLNVKGIDRNKETISIDTQKYLASKIGTTVSDIETGEAFKGLDLDKARDRINSFALAEQRVMQNFKLDAEDNLLRLRNGDKAAKLDFVEGISDVLEINTRVLDSIADIGRIQNFRKNIPEVAQINQIRDALAAADDDAIETLMKAVADLDGDELTKFLANVGQNPERLKQQSLKQLVDQWYMNSILSSPVTLISDTISNVTFTAYNKLLEKPLAAGIGGVRTLLGGNAPDRVMLAETGIFLQNLFEDGIAAAKIMRKGLGATREAIDQTKIENFTRFGKHRPRGFVVDGQILGKEVPPHLLGVARAFDNLAMFPSRFMQGKDDVVKGFLYRSAVRERAYRRAVMEGLQTGSEAFLKRVNELSVSPVDNVAENLDSLSGEAATQFDAALRARGDDARVALQIQRKSVKEAKKLTFTDKPTRFSEGINTAADNFPGGRFIIPFVTTIDNLTRRSIDRSLLPLLSPSVRQSIMKGGAEADEALARMMLGTTLMAGAYKWAVAGRLTGDGPANRSDKEALLQLGWRPRSVYINGRYIDISRLIGPLALMLQVPANMAEIYKYTDNELSGDLDRAASDKMVVASSAVASTIMSQSWARGLSELFDAINSEDEAALERTLNFLGSSLVAPNAISFVANELDPVLKQVDTMSEAVRAKYGMDVRPKRDLFGDPITRDDYLSVFLPATVSDTRNTPEWKLKLFEAGAYPTKPSKRISVKAFAGGDLKTIASGVELTADQYERMLEMIGEDKDLIGLDMTTKDAIKMVIESPAWEALPAVKQVDGAGMSKAEFIRKIYNKSVEMAQIKLVQENPELFERAKEKAIAERTKPSLSPLSSTVADLIKSDR